MDIEKYNKANELQKEIEKYQALSREANAVVNAIEVGKPMYYVTIHVNSDGESLIDNEHSLSFSPCISLLNGFRNMRDNLERHIEELKKQFEEL